ncbi:hypothetical protein [Lysinibacillus sp. G4S2]|uniref:hypothetical protein n=1 Tax=Lysinibacillus sp. G4S2 TaxID=3055859 RepID=UPI0025A0CD57|nr:hypothetical protein [Lysinibacillus sp. G4S2]MDM5249845.1 hypothetical protein [Lysinibacillus sp. G4S2]
MLKTNVKVSMCNSFLIIMTDLSKILVLQSANVFCAKAKRQQQNVFLCESEATATKCFLCESEATATTA